MRGIGGERMVRETVMKQGLQDINKANSCALGG